MKTILYANRMDNIGEKLENIIHAQVPGIQVKTCNSIELFSEMLRQPLNNISVVVLMVTTRDELVHFYLMKLLFDNIRIILILPDRHKDTLALSLKLKTSFISYIDSDLLDVTAVLGQILKITKENKKNV